MNCGGGGGGRDDEGLGIRENEEKSSELRR